MTKPTKPPRKHLDKAAIAAHLREVMLNDWLDPFAPQYVRGCDDFVERALELVEKRAMKTGAYVDVKWDPVGHCFCAHVYNGGNHYFGASHGPLCYRIACAVAAATGFPADKIEVQAWADGEGES